MKLLHLDSSILGDNSVSRRLSADVVARLTATHSGLDVTYRDLAADPVAHLTGSYLAAAQSPGSQPGGALAADLADGNAVLQQFLAADVLVIGVAFYNFTVPTQLKAWVDRILIAGQTFRYNASGVEGLCGSKRVILAVARGNFYGPTSPFNAYEHAETYLRTVFGFIGITDIEAIAAEGIGKGPEARQTAIDSAELCIAELA